MNDKSSLLNDLYQVRPCARLLCMVYPLVYLWMKMLCMVYS